MNYFAFNWLQVDKKDSSNGIELMRKTDEVFKEFLSNYSWWMYSVLAVPVIFCFLLKFSQILKFSDILKFFKIFFFNFIKQYFGLSPHFANFEVLQFCSPTTSNSEPATTTI